MDHENTGSARSVGETSIIKTLSGDIHYARFFSSLWPDSRLEGWKEINTQHFLTFFFSSLCLGLGSALVPAHVCVCVLLSEKMTRNGEYFPGSISLVTFGNYDEEWQEDTSLVRNCSRVQEDKRGIFM